MCLECFFNFLYVFFFFFFFNDTATTEIYTLSLHDALPICPNFSDASHPHPCQSCLLAEFVPEALRKEKAACRFIELTKDGQTLENLYRTGSQVEIEEALANWLRA